MNVRPDQCGVPFNHDNGSTRCVLPLDHSGLHQGQDDQGRPVHPTDEGLQPPRENLVPTEGQPEGVQRQSGLPQPGTPYRTPRQRDDAKGTMHEGG